jgi:hypothetical protein
MTTTKQMPPRDPPAPDPVITDLAKALSACVVWMEQFGCEVMLWREQCLMENARRALARVGYEPALEDFLEVLETGEREGSA